MRTWSRLALLAGVALAAGLPPPSTAQPRGPERGYEQRQRTTVEGERRQRIVDFVTDYYAQTTRDNATALSFLLAAYAPRVLYYGRELSRDEVLADKLRFLERWPRRNYAVRPDSATVRCEENNITCAVDVVIDFDAYNPETGRRSSGVTTSFLIVDQASGRPQIVVERGTVLSRD